MDGYICVVFFFSIFVSKFEYIHKYAGVERVAPADGLPHQSLAAFQFIRSKRATTTPPPNQIECGVLMVFCFIRIRKRVL